MLKYLDLITFPFSLTGLVIGLLSCSTNGHFLNTICGQWGTAVNKCSCGLHSHGARSRGTRA